MFTRSARIVGAGSRLSFIYIPAGKDGRPDVGRWTGLMLWLQKVAGEPWLWSIRPKDLGVFLVDTGWREAPEINNSAGKCGVEYLVTVLKI